MCNQADFTLNCKATFVVCTCIQTRNTPVNAGVESTLMKVKSVLQNTIQCPLPRLEPGPRDPGTSAVTMRPPRLRRNGTHWNALERNLTQRNETALKRRFISRKTY